jgi:FRG domain
MAYCLKGAQIKMEVKSINELIKHIQSIRRNPDQELWFRGHRSATWNIEPAIHRNYTRADENNFTNRFRSRASVRYDKAPEYDQGARWLSIMQHYGLPTRLLDWSRSPLVATYFAVQHYLEERNSETIDANVWILDPFLLNERQGFERVTPAIDAHTCEEMLVPAFTRSTKWPENNKVRAAMATETDLRMFVQQGCFTIHSLQTPLNKTTGSDEYLHSVMIPAMFVRDVADEIKVCGFRRGDIFPDLANLAEELRNSHPPGWAAGP